MNLCHDLCGVCVTEPTNGIYLKIDRLSDGTTQTAKVIVK